MCPVYLLNNSWQRLKWLNEANEQDIVFCINAPLSFLVFFDTLHFTAIKRPFPDLEHLIGYFTSNNWADELKNEG